MTEYPAFVAARFVKRHTGAEGCTDALAIARMDKA